MAAPSAVVQTPTRDGVVAQQPPQLKAGMKKKAKKGVRPGSSIADQIKTYFKEVLELIHVDLPDEIKYKLQVC